MTTFEQITKKHELENLTLAEKVKRAYELELKMVESGISIPNKYLDSLATYSEMLVLEYGEDEDNYLDFDDFVADKLCELYYEMED